MSIAIYERDNLGMVERESKSPFIKIEIDGSPIQKPQYANGLTDDSFRFCLEYAHEVVMKGWSTSGGPDLSHMSPSNREIVHQMARDPQFYSYLIGVIKRGYSGEELRSVDKYSSMLADLVFPQGKIPEISRKKNLLQQLSPKKLVVKRKQEDQGYRFPEPSIAFGWNLKRGTIVYRGDVDKVGPISGGTLYIDGNVGKLEVERFGVFYINGDVEHIIGSSEGIAIITGKIRRYTQEKYSAGGLRQEITPSPFLFSSYPIDGLRMGEEFRWGVNTSINPNAAQPFEGGMQVDSERLMGWLPQETRTRAVQLCRERINRDLELLREAAGKIKDPKALAEFYKKSFLGYTTGYVDGYYKHAGDSNPGD